MKFSRYTVVVTSAFLLSAGSIYGQAQAESGSNIAQLASANFYITTPQTGEQTVVGGNQQGQAGAVSHPSVAVSNLSNANMYLATAQSQIAKESQARRGSGRGEQTVESQGYTIEQVSNAPVRARVSSGRATSSQRGQEAAAQQVAAQQAAAHYYTHQQAYGHQHGHQHQQGQGQHHHHQQQGQTGQKRGLMSRIFNRHDHSEQAQRQQQAAAAQQAAQARQRASAAGTVSTGLKSSKHTGTVQSGIASWYGKKFDGGKTANGERYDMNSMTAAHKTLPFGTVVKVRNERNGRECIVRINNRGPFIKGRIIDLSHAAASKIGMVNSGIAKVKMEVLGREG